MTFKPLLASPVEFEHLDYTNCWLSPKLDGIRAIVRGSMVLSRKLLPIPNEEVQRLFGRPEFNGFDGELGVGDPTSPTFYLDTYSGVMKKSGKPDVLFYAFDHVGDPNLEYFRRYEMLSNRPGPFGDLVVKLRQHPVESESAILDLEQHYLERGYEGVMLRAFQGAASRYKFGRSTARQGTLLKLKRLEDFEAEIVGVEEELANNNEATTDELGNTKRSSHQENKSGKDTLGRFLCRYDKNGMTFRVGIFKGMDAAWKKSIWQEHKKNNSIVGQWVKLQKLPIGEKDLPRHPRVTAVLGLRSPIDM